MSTDLTLSGIDRDQIRGWLDELRQAGDEFQDFVAARLDDLDALRVLIDQRQGELDTRRDDLERQVTAFQAAQQRLDTANATAEKLADELRDQVQRLATDAGRALAEQADALRSERERVREELDVARSQTQSIGQSVLSELSQACAALVANHEQLSFERQKLADLEAPLCAALAAHTAARATEQHPVEPAHVSDQVAAAETASAADQHSLAGEATPVSDIAIPPEDNADEGAPAGTASNRGWTQELASLRKGLASSTLPESKKQAGPAGAQQDRANAAAPPAAAAETDPVLDSLMAQFESLQNDLAGGRTTARTTNTKQKTNG
jgi:DNA repair exonuclease SbcCD ATPase subunit